jgi:transposase
MWPGNTADVTTLVPIVKRMRERFRLREITVVADRGMMSQKTFEALEGSDPPVGYIIGVRMRRQKEVNLSVLGSRKQWMESVPERSNAKDPAPLKIKEVWVENRRYVVCLNEEERRKDAPDREAIVVHLKEQGTHKAEARCRAALKHLRAAPCCNCKFRRSSRGKDQLKALSEGSSLRSCER